MSDLWQKHYKVKEMREEIRELKAEVKSLGECHVEAHVLKDEIKELRQQLKYAEDKLSVGGDV